MYILAINMKADEVLVPSGSLYKDYQYSELFLEGKYFITTNFFNLILLPVPYLKTGLSFIKGTLSH